MPACISFGYISPASLFALLSLGLPAIAEAAGGPLGIDHRLSYDGSGIWARHDQLLLEDAVILTELSGALWLGGDERLGRTYWQGLDASVFSAATVLATKYAFGRERPSQTDSPNQWLKGGQSFPSGEVTLQASFVTPIIMQYSHDHPWVWSLELLPAYDAAARLKTQGHWQTDVLAGWAIGTAWGEYAHDRQTPFFLSLMPNGIYIGFHTKF